MGFEVGVAGDTGALRPGVKQSASFKREDIKKAVEAEAAAKKAQETPPPPPPSTPTPAPQPPAPQPKPPEPAPQAQAQAPAPAPGEPAKPPGLSPAEKEELEKKKIEAELELANALLHKQMEESLKGAEWWNLGGSAVLAGATLLAHLAAPVGIGLLLGKAGLMFWKKRQAKAALMEAQTQLSLLSADQIHELVEDLDQERLSFIDGLTKVSEAADKIDGIQQGATKETAKGEGVALAGDALEVGQAVTHIGGATAHVAMGALGPLIAAGYVFHNYRGIKKAKHHIEHLKKELEQIEAKLKGLPPPAEAPGGHH